ncbi:hypothetical protein ILUMI_16302 [Ignelater luminosus]|uniref:CCHC-type domain-containing protein n=1 Tax=Ignelater luminosus TaxID=2038154 RepID=A0A8K0CRI3_IGNLU|nr:hypothetical protein ILUMI_16302 [Ignelater luminosus]
MWTALQNTFERKGIRNQLLLRKQLLQLKLEERGTLNLHFLTFDSIVRSLKASGATLEENDIICHLLLTLPKSYEMVITAIETIGGSDLTLDFVKEKLLDEEIKQKSKNNMVEENSTAFAGRSSYNKKKWNMSSQQRYTKMANKSVNNGKYFRFKCHNCGQEGHKRSGCRRKEHTDSGKRNANNTVSGNCEDTIIFVAESCNGEKRDANNTISGKSKNDLGATDHMTNSECYFAETWELQQEIKIPVAKCGEAITARKAGNVKGYLVVNGKMYNQKCFICTQFAT